MRKGKRSATKPGKTGFSFDNVPAADDLDTFEGYPAFHAWDDGKTIEENCRLSMQSWLACLKHSDKHPPKLASDYEEFSWPYNLTIVFESFDQKCVFFEKYMPQLGDFMLEIIGSRIAEAFHIDLETGSPVAPYIAPEKKDNKKFNFSSSFNFSQTQLDFGNKKPEKTVPETLQNIRAEEKKLASYLLWTEQGDYYSNIMFKTEKEKSNFLKALNLEAEFDGKYIWGPDFAKALGLEVIPCEFKNKPLYAGRERRLEELIIDQ